MEINLKELIELLRKGKENKYTFEFKILSCQPKAEVTKTIHPSQIMAGKPTGIHEFWWTEEPKYKIQDKNQLLYDLNGVKSKFFHLYGCELMGLSFSVIKEHEEYMGI